MANLQELLKQKADLDKQIEAAKNAERSEAYKQIKEICELHKISYAQLKPILVKAREKRKSKTES